MPQKKDGDGEYLTVNEVAAILRVDARTIYRRIADGTLKEGVHYHYPGGVMRKRFKRAAFLAWLEHKPKGPVPVDHGIPPPVHYRKRG